MLSLQQEDHLEDHHRRSLATYETNDLSMVTEIGADDKPTRVRLCSDINSDFATSSDGTLLFGEPNLAGF
jgi:hypothetical protein